MKIWNSKYALTEGLTEHDGEEVGDGMAKVGPLYYLHGEGKEWHRTRESAVARAEVMREAKIASLKKAISRLEKLRFDA